MQLTSLGSLRVCLLGLNGTSCVLDEVAFVEMAQEAPELLPRVQAAGGLPVLATRSTCLAMVQLAGGGSTVMVTAPGQPAGAVLTPQQFAALSADPEGVLDRARQMPGQPVDLAPPVHAPVTDTSFLYAMDASGATAALILG